MKKKMDVIIVLDRSGSMQTVKKDTINGFNNFLKEQKEVNKEATFTLVQFDDQYQVDYYAEKIRDVIPLNEDSYVPRGLTALLDAVGKTIKMTRNRHREETATKKSRKTIFVIITDGLENNSTKYNRQQIFKTIRKLEENKNWEFVFLGANQDAIGEAANYGIEAKRAMRYAHDELGTTDMFFSLSHNICRCVSSEKKFAFTDEQRDKQKR